MEKINFSNTYFTTKGMMPLLGETISLLWARKIVNNLANTYGIIGTCIFANQRGYRSLNLQLTQKYIYPPSVYLYYSGESGNIHGMIETHPTYGEYTNLSDYRGGKAYALIQQDNLIIFCPTNTIYNVYYRIVGV